MQHDEPFQGVHDGAAPTPYEARPSVPSARRGMTPQSDTVGLVGRTPAMGLVREQITRFAKTTATVVVHGETGTGKELVASAVHRQSLRSARPFVAANVAALSESIVLSELFGHERGAFTGALARHRGLFEQAHGGTLFLDEVGELAPDAQAALLRVLEAREVRPVGAERARSVDVRLVVATHRNLAQMVRQGFFREDLYYRLHQLVIRLPPLRYRIADVPLLARHVLDALAPEVGPRALDRSALDAMGEYGWPGNVRQLHNVLRRAAIETDASVLTREHLRLALLDEPGAQREVQDGANAATIASVLAAERWNLTQAARRLGISRSTLRSRIRRAGLVRNG